MTIDDTTTGARTQRRRKHRAVTVQARVPDASTDYSKPHREMYQGKGSSEIHQSIKQNPKGKL